MKETYIKNLTLISFIMILIHIAGLTYQFITISSILAISFKILYITMFAIFLFSLIKKAKLSSLLGIVFSCVIIIISAIYMDFLSIVISILIIYYSYNLNKCNLKSFVKTNKEIINK